MNAERPGITIVTRNGGYQKDRIFAAALPDWRINRRDPSFDEDKIALRAPNNETRPAYISNEKAREDSAWVGAVVGLANVLIEDSKSGDGHLFMYTDSVQFIHETDGSLTIHEKPKGDPLVWASTSADAMAQSGKNIEIVSSLTGIRADIHGVSEPATVMVRAKATMRPFTREELIAFAKGSGAVSIPDTAGGIPLANGGRHFYDTSKPLVISVQDGLGNEPVELLRYETWAHVPDAALRPFVCGAFEPAVERLVQKTKLSPAASGT